MHFGSSSHSAQHCCRVTPQRSLFGWVFTTFPPTMFVLFRSAEQVECCLPGGSGGGGGGGGEKMPWIRAPVSLSMEKCCAEDPLQCDSSIESPEVSVRQ